MKKKSIVIPNLFRNLKKPSKR